MYANKSSGFGCDNDLKSQSPGADLRPLAPPANGPLSAKISPFDPGHTSKLSVPGPQGLGQSYHRNAGHHGHQGHHHGKGDTGAGGAGAHGAGAGTGTRGTDLGRLTTPPKPRSSNLDEAQANTNPTFAPVLRADNQQLDSEVHNEKDFGALVDKVANEYGLDPAMFRAQLQAESGAFNGPTGYLDGMKLVGDTDRASSNNASYGLGQISRNYLDNGPWAQGGAGNARVGSQVVSLEQYQNSVSTQLRMAASNDAQRIADSGGDMRTGLAKYVNGSADMSNPKVVAYLQNIDKSMRDPNIQTG